MTVCWLVEGGALTVCLLVDGGTDCVLVCVGRIDCVLVGGRGH